MDIEGVAAGGQGRGFPTGVLTAMISSDVGVDRAASERGEQVVAVQRCFAAGVEVEGLTGRHDSLLIEVGNRSHDRSPKKR